LAALVYAGPLHVMEIETVAVNQVRESYRVTLIFSVDAPVLRARAVLTDYAHLHKLNPAIIESKRVLAPCEGATRVRMRMRGCVLFLCQDIECTEDLHKGGSGSLQAVIVPQLSDMKSGHASWRFKPLGNITRISFRSRMVPDFWIPPLIGSFILKHWLHGQLIETAENLERLASPNP
jgi:hypothetical protein